MGYYFRFKCFLKLIRGVYYMYFGVFFLGDVFRVFDFLGFDKFGFWLYFCFIRNG